MCDLNVFIYKDGQEDRILESVDRIETEKDKTIIRSIFGEHKEIAAKFKYYDNRQGKIVFESV